MTDESPIDRGVRAERILNDPLYQEAWSKYEAACWETFKKSPARDKEGREYLFLMIKAAADARAALEQVMRDGKVALHTREQKGILTRMFR